MAAFVKNLTQLVDFNATTKQKVFTVKYDYTIGSRTYTTGRSIFFANIEKYDNEFDPENIQSNRFCLSSSQEILHNIYDSNRILFHGLAARRHRYPYSSTDDFQHIYKANKDENFNYLNNGLCCIVKVQDSLYGLDSPKEYGHYYINDDMYSWLAQDNGYSYPKPQKYATLLYRNEEDIKDLSPIEVVKSKITGISSNTLFEIPGNMYTDYSSGSMYATTVKCKTEFNAIYSMQHDSRNNNVLTNCRRYSGIYSCNNQLYLKFSDIERYKHKSQNDITNGDFTYTSISVETDGIVNPTTQVEQIEFIQNINRGATPSNHKSSLYSLRLVSPDLEKIHPADGSSDEKIAEVNNIRENVRQEVKNMIRSLAERVAPANTQLFSVTVNSQ